MPARDCVGAHQQSDAAEHVAVQPVRQGGQERPVGRGEPGFVAVQLPFEDGDLVAQRQDFDVLGVVAHRQEPEHREGAGDAEVGQPQQHDRHPRSVVTDDVTRVETLMTTRMGAGSHTAGDQGGRTFRHPQGR